MNSVRREDIQYIINNICYEKCEGKTFLITGANGFLASYLVDTLMTLSESLLDNKCKVIALCRNAEKGKKRFEQWLHNQNFTFLIQNVEEPIKENLEVDYIIHAAGNSKSADALNCPVDTLKANILGSYNLLEYAKDRNLSGFLFFSSGAVYGDAGIKQGEIKETDIFPLDFLAPKNSYAEGKRCGEALCKGYFTQYHIPTKIVRISHTYGPGIDLTDGHVYSDFVDCILQHKDIIIRNGGEIRPFCYIADATVAFLKILLEGEAGEIYNMANKEETLSIYDLALKLTGEAFPERRISVKCLRNDTRNMITVNNDKLMQLGWHPTINVIEGFRRTVRSFEE